MEAKTKTCIKCQLPKPLGMFYERKDTKTRRTTCEDCVREYKHQWWLDHPKENRTYKENKRRGINTRTENPFYKRQWILRRASLYRVAPAVIDALILASKGQCEICEVPLIGHGLERNAMCVDHNHATNVPQGILCPGCNAAIGHLKEIPIFAEHAARYLRRIAG